MISIDNDGKLTGERLIADITELKTLFHEETGKLQYPFFEETIC